MPRKGHKVPFHPTLHASCSTYTASQTARAANWCCHPHCSSCVMHCLERSQLHKLVFMGGTFPDAVNDQEHRQQGSCDRMRPRGQGLQTATLPSTTPGQATGALLPSLRVDKQDQHVYMPLPPRQAPGPLLLGQLSRPCPNAHFFSPATYVPQTIEPARPLTCP